MKINKTIQNELDNLPTEIKNKYNVSLDTQDAGIAVEFNNKNGYIHIKFDKSFKIICDETYIEIKNKKMILGLWIKNYIWHLTVY